MTSLSLRPEGWNNIPEQLGAPPLLPLIDLLLYPAGEGQVEVLLVGAEGSFAAKAAEIVRPV